VFTTSGEPGQDGGVVVGEHPRGGRDREPFRQRRQDFTNTLGWSFQTLSGVSRREQKVVPHAWQRNDWMRSCFPWVPSPTRAWRCASAMR
jgi:hypothetical protein